MKEPKKVYTKKLWGSVVGSKLTPIDEDPSLFEFHTKKKNAVECLLEGEKVIKVTITYEV